jgi:hypothetical protein
LSALPREVERFVVEHIGSVEELEILLLLRAYRSRDWTGDAVAQELRLDPQTSAERLVDLQRRGFVARNPSSPDAVLYAPRAPESDHALAVLAQLYPRFRNAIIRLIFSKPNEKVQSFADSFRIKGDDEK